MIGAEEQLPKPIKSALERNDHCWATFGREEVDFHRSTVLHALAGTHVHRTSTAPNGNLLIPSPMYILSKSTIQ